MKNRLAACLALASLSLAGGAAADVTITLSSRSFSGGGSVVIPSLTGTLTGASINLTAVSGDSYSSDLTVVVTPTTAAPSDSPQNGLAQIGGWWGNFVANSSASTRLYWGSQATSETAVPLVRGPINFTTPFNLSTNTSYRVWIVNGYTVGGGTFTGTLTLHGVSFASFYTDGDGDGYGGGSATTPTTASTSGTGPVTLTGVTAGMITTGGDCNDSSTSVYPGAAETCANDGIDNDCDGEANADSEASDATAYYPDSDGDGYGSRSASATMSCTALAGWVTNNTDCNDANSAVTPQWNPICFGPGGDTVDANSGVESMLQVGTDIYMSGSFTSWGGVSATNVARWDGTTFNALGTGLGGGRAAAMSYGAGKIFMGGTFTTAGGVTANRVAAWNPTTSQWSALVDSVTGQTGVASTVYDVLYTNNKLFVCGLGDMISGGVTGRVVYYDFATSRWVEACTSTPASGFSGGPTGNETHAMCVSGGKLYTTGYGFRFMEYDLTTGNWKSYSIGGGSDRGRWLEPLADGRIAIGFHQGSTAFFRIFNPATSTFSLASSSPNNAVVAMARHSDGRLVVAGDFTAIGALTANRFAIWDPVANTWSTFGSTGFNSEARAIVIDETAVRTWVGGAFTTVGSGNGRRVAYWDCPYVPTASLLRMTTEPAGAQNAVAFTTQPVVQIADCANNAFAGAGVSVTATLSAGTGTLSGTTTVSTDANGTATFTDLSIAGTAGSNTMRLTFAASGITSVNSSNFSLTVGSAAKLAMATQPSASVANGAVLATQPRVRLQDSSGNNVSLAGVEVTVSLASGSGTLGGTLTATTDSNGLAIFSGLSITGTTGTKVLGFAASVGGSPLTGATSSNITLTAGSPAALAITTAPPATVTSGTNFPTSTVVQLRDQSGNNCTNGGVSIVVSIASGSGTLSGTLTRTTLNGAATFNDLRITGLIGTRTLAFDSTGLPQAVSGSIQVNAGSAAALAVTTQPSSSAANAAAFAQQPAVRLVDSGGNTVATSGVTLTAAIATGGGTLGGTLTATTDAAGIATFTDLSITGTTGNRTLSFSSSGLTGVASGTITITAGSAAALAVTTEPVGGASGGALPTQPIVRIVDGSGNTVTSNNSTVVTAAIQSGAGGTLGGTTTATVSAGTATFTNLTLAGTVGQTYVLRFTATGLTGVDAQGITVTPGAASRFLVTTSASSPTAGGTVTITAQLSDANDNAVATANETVTWTKSFTGGSFASSTSQTDASGVATVVFTTPTTVATGTVTATTGSLSGTSGTITTVPGAASAATSTVAASPTSIAADGSATSSLTVQLKDANGNDLASGGATVTFLAPGAGLGSIGSVTDEGDGTYSATYTAGTTASSVTITPRLSGTNFTNTTSVTLTPGAASAATSTVAASPTSLAADGSATSTLTVQLKDANGNDLASGGATVTFLAPGAGLGSIGSVTDEGDGTYTATYTAGTTAGGVTITAELGGNAIANTASITLSATVPAAPTSLLATAGNGSASIAFTTPTITGGSAITNYEYTLDAGANWTAFSPAATTSPVSVTGLTNGTAYSIALRAVNAIGAGASSSAVSVTPATVPGVPTIAAAAPGHQSASITFTAPVSDGGSAITDHEYELDASGIWISFGTTSSPATISGLTNGQSYSVSIRAVNAVGAGAGSTVASVIPATVPGAPTGLSASADDQSIEVIFTAPTSDGGSAITNYEYTLDSGVNWTAFSPATTASPVTVTGLTNGTAYSISLRAVNAMGEGAASGAVSATPTPCAVLAVGYEDLRVDSAGGESAVELDASGSCPWSATSSQSWLVIDPPTASGTGPGEIAFSVAANATNLERTATITITGSVASPVVYTVTQTRSGTTTGWGLPKYGLDAPPAGEGSTPFASASANRRNNAAVRANGTVVVWGLDTDGQNTVPAALSNPATANVIQVATGQRHVLALQASGTVVAWGRNTDGQCNVPAGLSAISIAAGRAHSLAVRSDGTVAAWGRNQVGQCNVPAGLSGVIAVSAGDWHSVALKSDGSVVAWGDNAFGQATVPSGLSNVSMISAGRNHTLALRSNGTVVAWGDDRQGQSTVRADLQNPATANVVQVSGGRTSSVALQSDGTIVYMGTTPNGSGATPAGLSGVIAIAAGDDATLAIVPPVPTPPGNSAGGTLGGGAIGATLRVPEEFGTIGEAVAAAGEGSTILVGRGIYRETLHLGDRGLTLVGVDGAEAVVIDAGGLKGSAVTIASIGGNASGLVTRVTGVTLRGGDAEAGGGLLVDHAVAELVEGIVRENRAAIGGGVAVRFGDLLVESSVIEGNVAEAFGGGGHATSAGLLLLDSTISGNLAGESGGGVWSDLESMVLADGLVLCGNLPDEAAFEGDLPPEPPRSCPIGGDLDGDGVVGAGDLALLLAAWGECEGCGADLDGDGEVDGSDMAVLLTGWMTGVGGGA